MNQTQITQKSLKGNSIIIDPQASNSDLEEILTSRFEDERSIHTNIDDLYDPYLLRDMDTLVQRVTQAKNNNEKVVIF